jgi:ferredoxin-NADP reductase
VAEGPFGRLTGGRHSRPKVLLVAGGIGVTPLRALFGTLPVAPGDLTLAYRAREPADLVLRAELEELARRRKAHLVYLLGRRDQGPDPLGPEQLRANLPDIADHDVYICGQPGFVDQVSASVRAAGVPRRQVHCERFEL